MVEGQEGVRWEDWLALARATEELGFEALFRSDHYGPVVAQEERGSLDAWATLAGLAGVTSRIRLGTLVSPATFRHPSVLAKNAVTVDHISGGRVEVGLGAGWNEAEHRRYGFPFPPLGERMDVFAEQLEIVHRQWSEESFSFEGKHYTLERTLNSPQPLRRPHPPIMIGGGGERKTLRLVAQYAQACNLFAGPELERKLDVLREHCATVGRSYDDIEKTVMLPLDVGPDGRDVDVLLRELERLAGLGIAHVHGRVNEMETITPLEIIGERVIPVAASF